jgi:hypothetical protein
VERPLHELQSAGDERIELLIASLADIDARLPALAAA